MRKDCFCDVITRKFLWQSQKKKFHFDFLKDHRRPSMMNVSKFSDAEQFINVCHSCDEWLIWAFATFIWTLPLEHFTFFISPNILKMLKNEQPDTFGLDYFEIFYRNRWVRHEFPYNRPNHPKFEVFGAKKNCSTNFSTIQATFFKRSQQPKLYF